MTIYKIDEYAQAAEDQAKKSFFSVVAARCFFFLLLVANIAWGIYTIAALGISLFGLKRLRVKSWLNVKRFLVCTNALLVALISPALGIMFACSYFLMYDKAGIDEIVPALLRDQFKVFFHSK